MKTAVQKAYEIDLDRIESGYLYSGWVCYADNRTEARYKLLKEVRYESLALRSDPYQELNFLNIPVIRANNYDKTMFEGEWRTREYIVEVEKARERNKKLDTILADPAITHCYIQKGSYYAPNMCGYTDSITRAGVYTKEEAVSHVRSVGNAHAIPIPIKEHNEYIQNAIIDLQSRLILINPLPLKG